MRKFWDYDCECGERFEVFVEDDEEVVCSKCSSRAVTRTLGGRVFETIIPMHRTSLKSKAGYVHTHGDRPAERGSVSVPANKGSV